MAGRTLTPASLEALGAPRLVALPLGFGADDPVGDFGTIPDHAAYEQVPRVRHANKAAFWQEVQLSRPSPRRSMRRTAIAPTHDPEPSR